MPVTLQRPERARFPLCTGIIEISGVCREADPFFLSLATVGQRLLDRLTPNPKEAPMPRKSKDATATPDREARSSRSTAVSRRRVVSRLWRTAERQVSEIEGRMQGLADDPQALERDAKTLAIIAKTVRDLVAIDGEAGELTRSKENKAAHGARTSRPEHPADAGGDDAGPRDIEGFRAELARRLDELCRERAGGGTP